MEGPEGQRTLRSVIHQLIELLLQILALEDGICQQPAAIGAFLVWDFHVRVVVVDGVEQALADVVDVCSEVQPVLPGVRVDAELVADLLLHHTAAQLAFKLTPRLPKLRA